MLNEKSKTSTVKVITLHTQEIKKDKKVFYASSAEICGKWYKIKFTMDCEGAPKEKGLYTLTIDIDECSVETGKVVKNSAGKEVKTADIIWVKSIVNLQKYSDEDLKEENRKLMGNIFTDNSCDLE